MIDCCFSASAFRFANAMLTQVFIDQKSVRSGSLEDEFDFLEPRSEAFLRWWNGCAEVKGGCIATASFSLSSVFKENMNGKKMYTCDVKGNRHISLIAAFSSTSNVYVYSGTCRAHGWTR